MVFTLLILIFKEAASHKFDQRLFLVLWVDIGKPISEKFFDFTAACHASGLSIFNS